MPDLRVKRNEALKFETSSTGFKSRLVFGSKTIKRPRHGDELPTDRLGVYAIFVTDQSGAEFAVTLSGVRASPPSVDSSGLGLVQMSYEVF